MKRTSLVATQVNPGNRSVKKVPFVELMSGRIQGVVSSGSDIKRVYVSFLEGETGNFNCSTNNNRPCGGLRGGPCKHIMEMVFEAIVQFGGETVAHYLGIDNTGKTFRDSYDILGAIPSGHLIKESSGVVFSRFLNYLRYCELETQPSFTQEMDWF